MGEALERRLSTAERDPSKLKVYIAVRDDVPDDLVPLVVAHAILSADDVFGHKDIWKEWKAHSFKKVIVRVTPNQLDEIDYAMQTVPCYEENVLDSVDCVTVVLPFYKDTETNKANAKYLRKLPLWAVKGEQ